MGSQVSSSWRSLGAVRFWGLDVYVTVVSAVVIPTLAFFTFRSLDLYGTEWIPLAVLIAIAGFFPITLSNRRTRNQSISVTVCEIFVFLGLLYFGPHVAVTLSLIDSAFNNIRSGVKHIRKVLFNVSTIGLSTWISGQVLYVLLSASPPLNRVEIASPLIFFVLLDVVGLLLFATNTLAVSGAIALASGQSFFRTWTNYLRWSPPATIVGASLEALLFLIFGELEPISAGVAVLPILVVVHMSYRVSSKSIRDALEHAKHTEELFKSTTSALAIAVNAKDECTNGHVHRVQALAQGIAHLAGLDERPELRGLWAASLLHDIGKLAVPEHILKKPAELSTWEMQVMRGHAQVGAQMLESIPFPYQVKELVGAHHERWDSTGYPAGLRGTEIPLGARILSIADTYDALRSDRPYRRRMTVEAAIQILQSESGKAFAPMLVAVAVTHVDTLEKIIKEAESNMPIGIQAEKGVGLDLEGEFSGELRDSDVHTRLQQEHASVRSILHLPVQHLPARQALNELAGSLHVLAPFDSFVVFLVDADRDHIFAWHSRGLMAGDLGKSRIPIAEGTTG